MKFLLSWGLILLLLNGTWAQTPGPMFRVAGVAVDSASGEPVKHVRISIAPADHLNLETALVTGSDGGFGFDLPKGKYRLRAERGGIRQDFGESSLYAGFGLGIVTGSDQKTDNLIFRLHTPSAVSGKITDEAGEPIESALVQLLRSSVTFGRRRTGSYRWAYTNDIGEYRFGQLPSGTYYAVVTAHPWYEEDRGYMRLAGSQLPNPPQKTYATVYYPGTVEARAAAPLEVKAGQEATADFRLSITPGFNISVRSETKRPSRMRLSLIGEGVQGQESFQRVVDVFGSVSNIPAVPPGRYTIRVVSLNPQEPASAYQTVEIVSSDVEVTVIFKDPIPVTGTVRVEGGDLQTVARLLIALRDDGANRTDVRRMDTDGSFKFPNVKPGRYIVGVTGLSGVFLKSVTSEAGVVKDNIIEVGDTGPVRLMLVASKGVGRVQGFVRAAEGKAVAGVLAVLAPSKESNDVSNYHAFQTDSDGSFDFQNVRPGNYRLFAVQNPEFEYANPAAVRPFLTSAQAVPVEAQGIYARDIEFHVGARSQN